MKRVFLYAYDKVNLGDDLFIRFIAERYPDTIFYLWSNRINKDNFSDQKNLKIIDSENCFINIVKLIRPSLVHRIKAYYEKKSNAVVYIGGSIFMEYDSWKGFASWLEYEAINRPFYVLGANFGPYKTEIFKNQMQYIFGLMKDVCFRDRFSESLFSEVATVRYAPDILFASMNLYNSYNKKRQVFVSLINSEIKAKDDEKLLNKMEICRDEVMRVCREFLADGYSVVLSSFCEEEGDEVVVEELEKLLNSNQVTVLNYNGRNSAILKKCLAESQYVIGERFHAVVLGLAAGCSVIPVIYSDKTNNILNDLGFSGQIADIRTLSVGNLDYQAIMQKPEEQRLPNMKDIVEESQKHFALLDKILRG